MVPIRGEWNRFADLSDQLDHYRRWGLIPEKGKKLRPIMVTDGYFGCPEPCKVVGYQGDSWAVIELPDGYHAIHGDYLAELQPDACQKLPYGICFAEILECYVVVDIETTGFDHQNDRIIEIAAIKCEYGKQIAQWTSLVNPGMIIPQSIEDLTGITQIELDEAPSLEEVTPAFLDFIGNYPIVGHNAQSFDIPFLSAQMSVELVNPVIDTLPLARVAFDLLDCHKLEYLKDSLNLNGGISHRAMQDVQTTNSLLWACLAPRKYEPLVWEAYFQSLGNRKNKKKSRSNSHRTRKKQGFHKVDLKSITSSVDPSNQDGPLAQKTIVFTGTLSIPREEAMQIAVDAGAVLKSGVSGKTDYLVVGKQDITLVGFDGLSTKEEKAIALNKSGKGNVAIINEDEFLKLAGKAGALL